MNSTEKRRVSFVKRNQQLCDEIFTKETREFGTAKVNKLIAKARKELSLTNDKDKMPDYVIRSKIAYTWRVLKEGEYSDAR